MWNEYQHGLMTSSPYIELVKKTLIDHLKINSYEYYLLEIVNLNWKTASLFPLHKLLKKKNFGICKIKYVSENDQVNGYDWPSNALTMIGLNHLNNIEFCVRNIINDKIEDDFIETEVWRGGATILMRAFLKDFNINDRNVWLADSFEGLPKPNTKLYPEDRQSNLHKHKILTATKEKVEKNFKSFDLPDDKVILLKGWFKNTLPTLEVEKFSLLRLDGNLYESTHLAQKYLYPKVFSRGYVIVDDYNAFSYCKAAVDTFRKENKIEEPLIKIDKEAIYWCKK